MVNRKNLNSNALISVYDKSSLGKICAVLTKYNIGLISTGATAKKISSLGYKCKEISNLTKFKEILDGRVKTINPKIHASILFKRDNEKHVKTFKKLNFPKIDFVIVNFYPFSKISDKANLSKKIEMIDIGGPSMARSASKNFESITTICNKKYYEAFLKEMQKNQGKTTLVFRKLMAEKNFKLTSDYDLSIFKWLNNKKRSGVDDKIKIKYGENPNQKAYFVQNSKSNIFNAQINGKKIGYNNILDISEGLNCLDEFKEPTCVIVKHNNPCGVGSSKNIKTSYLKALESDPISAFGGVILVNKKINRQLANLIKRNYFEAVVAPEFEKQAFETLKSNKKLILISSDNLKEKNTINKKSVKSGVLYQELNSYKVTKSKIKLVSTKKTSNKSVEDLLFAFKVVKHVKSNAIVLVKDKQTLGIGAGQMSRLDATRMAIIKYKDSFKNKKFVCASDAFFPFIDNLEILLKNKCCAILQPSGSKNDIKIINYAKENKLPLYFTKNRVFKH